MNDNSRRSQRAEDGKFVKLHFEPDLSYQHSANKVYVGLLKRFNVTTPQRRYHPDWADRRVMLKYQLHREQELFDRAYAYVKEYYRDLGLSLVPSADLARGFLPRCWLDAMICFSHSQENSQWR